jgi:N-acylneuraminate cytidylyltransferase
MKRIALVPVRAGSARVPEKNFRPFGSGQSLLEIKLRQLVNQDCFETIYVSSDSPKAQASASSLGLLFHQRDPHYCQQDTSWADTLTHMLESLPEQALLTIALATSPLFTRFGEALDALATHPEKDSLVAVLPRKAFLLDEFGQPWNFRPGDWHPYSQELAAYHEVAGACFIATVARMKRWRYWFGPRPFLFPLQPTEAVDIDTMADFQRAQELWKQTPVF